MPIAFRSRSPTTFAVRCTWPINEREARSTMKAANASSTASGAVSHSTAASSASRRSGSGSATCR